MSTIGALLLSGGKGTRMGGNTPKQFLTVGGTPLSMYSFQLLSSLCETVVVVCSSTHHDIFPRGTLFADPGVRRQDSVYSGLRALPPACDWVLVHDSARPCLRIEDVRSLLEVGMKCGAAALGVPVKDTIKECNDAGQVVRTLDRSTLWKIHTPQLIRRDWLEEGFEKIIREGATVTDDVSIAEWLGKPVTIVPDHATNIKVTTPEDLPMVEQWLATVS
jgi:2-C-methyl-D-erythritol 4-phosphate cytidylyltransferase